MADDVPYATYEAILDALAFGGARPDATPGDGRFESVAEIAEAHRRSGGFFFDADTLRHWKSKIHNQLYGGRYFVTSEPDSDGHDRRYTVRRATWPTGRLDSDGQFRQHPTRTAAHRAAAAAAEADTLAQRDAHTRQLAEAAHRAS